MEKKKTMNKIDYIISDLNDRADAFDLCGVEFTEEDAMLVIKKTNNGISYDDAIDSVLEGIKEVLDF